MVRLGPTSSDVLYDMHIRSMTIEATSLSSRRVCPCASYIVALRIHEKGKDANLYAQNTLATGYLNLEAGTFARNTCQWPEPARPKRLCHRCGDALRSGPPNYAHDAIEPVLARRKSLRRRLVEPNALSESAQKLLAQRLTHELKTKQVRLPKRQTSLERKHPGRAPSPKRSTKLSSSQQSLTTSLSSLFRPGQSSIQKRQCNDTERSGLRARLRGKLRQMAQELPGIDFNEEARRISAVVVSNIDIARKALRRHRWSLPSLNKHNKSPRVKEARPRSLATSPLSRVPSASSGRQTTFRVRRHSSLRPERRIAKVLEENKKSRHKSGLRDSLSELDGENAIPYRLHAALKVFHDHKAVPMSRKHRIAYYSALLDLGIKTQAARRHTVCMADAYDSANDTVASLWDNPWFCYVMDAAAIKNRMSFVWTDPEAHHRMSFIYTDREQLYGQDFSGFARNPCGLPNKKMWIYDEVLNKRVQFQVPRRQQQKNQLSATRFNENIFAKDAQARNGGKGKSSTTTATVTEAAKGPLDDLIGENHKERSETSESTSQQNNKQTNKRTNNNARPAGKGAPSNGGNKKTNKAGKPGTVRNPNNVSKKEVQKKFNKWQKEQQDKNQGQNAGKNKNAHTNGKSGGNGNRASVKGKPQGGKGKPLGAGKKLRGVGSPGKKSPAVPADSCPSDGIS